MVSRPSLRTERFFPLLAWNMPISGVLTQLSEVTHLGSRAFLNLQREHFSCFSIDLTLRGASSPATLTVVPGHLLKFVGGWSG